jgi:hydrogenase-4 membrane subunit HyfE
MKTTTLKITILALVVWEMTARPAHAYLDPGVGSHAVQMALAGLFGALFAFKSAIQALLLRLRVWRQK